MYLKDFERKELLERGRLVVNNNKKKVKHLKLFFLPFLYIPLAFPLPVSCNYLSPILN